VRRLGEGATGLRRVGHLRWRHGNYYAPGHLWIRQLAGRLRVGLDDVAQRILPEIDTVTLPSPGTALKKGDVIGLIRSFSGTVALRAPVPGLVIAVNPAVQRTPSLLHADPYRRAWLVEVAPEGSEYRALPSGRRARAWLAREDGRLTDFFEHQLGIAAADGGELMVPPHRLLSAEQWAAVTREFLGDDQPAAGNPEDRPGN
jgi:glycine cleavage system H lipoate-binding protein